jgi:hypothetical protein
MHSVLYSILKSIWLKKKSAEQICELGANIYLMVDIELYEM